ncbi:MAG: glucosamine-6-phosphate deaminase [Cytophagales bacterium]|nr:glucosamine-6-phosphate deaminase [Cytophagales bacterium]
MKGNKKVDHLTYHIYGDRDLLGYEAAKSVAVRLRELLEVQATVNMVFGAAPSQNEFLASLRRVNQIDWGRIRAFHMDEYVGLDQDAPQLFGNFLKVRLFDRLPFKSVFYLDGNADDLEAECRRYSELLNSYPLDIACLGIGENAHIAFNDPHVADFNDSESVKIVNLDRVCRQQQVNDKCFISYDQVPLRAVTLTIPALLGAKYVFCVVPGKTKATAVRHTLRGRISETYPSTILRRHPEAVLFLDKGSAGRLLTSKHH